MARKADVEKVRLECPMCLDDFKNATFLSCGHTFCMECLQEYDEQHYSVDCIICPVCRKSTKLGPDRISGLTPNFSVKGVEDKINHTVTGREVSYCLLHVLIYKDIFCADCRKFICLKCYLESHNGHAIVKKEEMEGNLTEKRESLIHNSKVRKTQIEKCLNNALETDQDMHRHLNNVENDIKDTFARKVTILQESEELLLKRIDDIRKDCDNQSKRYIANLRRIIDEIELAMALLTDNVSEPSDSNTIQAYHMLCRGIDDSLKEAMDSESMVRPKQAAENVRFCPGDEKLLDLGHIEMGTKADFPSAKVATSERKTKIMMLGGINEMVILRMVKLPDFISGMAVLSQDAVVVGYGWRVQGADCFLVSGEKIPHLESEVGRVYDITLLPDGRSVASHDHSTCQGYNNQGNQIRGMKYTCMNGSNYPRLCCDQDGKTYAVNGSPNVFIFQGNYTKPYSVVNTGDIKPEQVCVTRTGVIITSTGYLYSKPITVMVFDRDGRVGSSVTVSDTNECLYAAVDSQDRVLIARVRKGSDEIKLTRYTLQGLTLAEEVKFNPLKLHEPCKENWSYMVSLTPDLMAFAVEASLYFIQLVV